MKRALTVATCLLCLAAGGAAGSKTDVFITSTTKTDTPARPGDASSEAAAVARAMELFLAEALDRVRPCTSAMTPTDVQVLLGHARDRELLGSGDDQALANIAGSMGSDFLVHVDVIQLNGSANVSVSMTSTRTARTVTRTQTKTALDDHAVDALQAFASEAANQMAREMKACPVMDRYQQQDQASRAEQRERTTHAEARVSAYAATIK